MNQANCTTCPAGYYCTANSTTYTDKICPSGHYCPPGTQSDTQHPCPQGSFNNHTGQANDSACSPCTPGYYCGFPGLSTPTDQCDPGWYCTLQSYLAQPTAPEGGMCVAGKRVTSFVFCIYGKSSTCLLFMMRNFLSGLALDSLTNIVTFRSVLS